MEGFRIRRKFRLRCFNIEGRDPRARFGRERKVNRRMMRSLKALQVAASEIEELYRRTRAVIQLMSEANKLADGWIYEFLIMIENDPLMMNAFEMINAQNLDVTSEEHIDQNQDDLYDLLSLMGW
ncbi:hypothetical protein Goshw_024099 [Gossypium schwendimanii]|uniref:Uncharacterized protein n=1 Tax=Gossypium schwendimanii TaxID=34291 RepID=A0A7J9LQS2_GOSSC|nr:hypothetical protein [Gossypium schwendimanii]